MKPILVLFVVLLIPSVQTQTTSEVFEKALANLDKQIQIDPTAAAAYHERGCVHFKLGNFKASVRDFDKYVELRPEHKSGHWQRGISCYYAGQYDDGRRQFEGCQETDGNDVENAVWRFMCMAKGAGIPKARRDMLKMGDDRRVPMRQVYELFSGKLKPTDVFAAARGTAAANLGPEAQNRRLFYAYLYVGFYYDLEGKTAARPFYTWARRRLSAAAA